MSAALIILVTGIYATIGALEFWDGNAGLGITFTCYAGANVGLLMVSSA
jgi:hypothetical protein